MRYRPGPGSQARTETHGVAFAEHLVSLTQRPEATSLSRNLYSYPARFTELRQWDFFVERQSTGLVHADKARRHVTDDGLQTGFEPVDPQPLGCREYSIRVGKCSPIRPTGVKTESDPVHAPTWTEFFNIRPTRWL